MLIQGEESGERYHHQDERRDSPERSRIRGMNNQSNFVSAKRGAQTLPVGLVMIRSFACYDLMRIANSETLQKQRRLPDFILSRKGLWSQLELTLTVPHNLDTFVPIQTQILRISAPTPYSPCGLKLKGNPGTLT